MSVSNVTGPCHKKHRYLHTLNTGHLEPHIMELNIVSRALVDALVQNMKNSDKIFHFKDMEVDELARTTSLGR